MLNPIVCLVIHYILLIRTGTFTDTQKGSDKIFDAIREVHEHLDDDHDGQINENESAHYMKTELKAPVESRQLHFHNNDAHISVDDLWKKWLDSHVYAWSVDDVVRWLKNTVKLPKYEETFRKNNVIGKNIPRLATSKSQYVQQELKITSPIDRQKIYLRASDLVLFGDLDEHNKEEKHEIDKNFIAIKAIHSHLDDDQNGEINVEESVEFVRDELKGSNTKRHASFHSNDDHISVEDLWKSWKNSAVYNWTNKEVVSWLKDIVGLPQYEQTFREKNVDGKSIPRLATDKTNFLQKELGVLNSTHRQKIYLRASDIILFGAHEVQKNYFSDTIVLLTVLIASLLCFYAIHQKSASKKQIKQLTSNMEYLKQAEQMLKELQESEGSNVSKEKELQLRGEIEEAKKEAQRLHQEHSKYEEEKTKLQLVEQELCELRVALAKAENEIKYNEFRSPSALQNLLIITYKKENQHFQHKKQQALAQMQEAKEACEKVNKTRRAVFGSLRLAHGQSIDVVDQKILNAKSSLAEVTKNLQERQQRWQQIEYICNFNIVSEESNLNLQGKHSLSKALLNDNLFGSKGRLDILDSQVAGLSENEQLDNEVEAITRKGKIGRISTESSSSQESIHSKNMFSEPQKQSSPSPLEKTVNSNVGSDDINVQLCCRNSISPRLDVEVLHTSATCPNLEQLLPEARLKRNNFDKVYTRANTEPSNLSREPVENGATEKSRHGSKKSKATTRPLSLSEPKDLKKQKKVLTLARFTNALQ